MSALPGLGPAPEPRPHAERARPEVAGQDEGPEETRLEAIFAALLLGIGAPANLEATESGPGMAGSGPGTGAPTGAGPGTAFTRSALGEGGAVAGPLGVAVAGAGTAVAGGPGVTLTLSLAALPEDGLPEGPLASVAGDAVAEVSEGEGAPELPVLEAAAPQEPFAPTPAEAEAARAAAQATAHAVEAGAEATEPAPDPTGADGATFASVDSSEGEGAPPPASAPVAASGASRLLGRLADTPMATRADVRVLAQRPGESVVEVEHPELGRVRLRVATGAGGVDVRAVAESLGAAWALRRSEDELRPRIARLGTELRRFDVRTGGALDAPRTPARDAASPIPRKRRPGGRLHRKA